MIYRKNKKKGKRVRIGILFGGESAEHEVSIKSAKAVYSNIDRERFDPELIYIGRDGKWKLIKEEELSSDHLPTSGFQSFIPWEILKIFPKKFDILFPVLHGPNGEDGKIQGLFEMSGIPYVGANSFSSALAMDKGISKTLFRENGLKVADFLVFTKINSMEIIPDIEREIGYPCYIKPCSLGSSVGISKVINRNNVKSGIDLAFKYDSRIIVEKEIKGSEFEISVMGNSDIRVSRPGSFMPSRDFYDYEDKYILGKTEFFIPAKLDKKIESKLKYTALKAYRSLYLNGFSRVDFFVEKETNNVIVNEINTIPGFTEISMFPKLWEVEGISFSRLITILIEYGFEYFYSNSRKLIKY